MEMIPENAHALAKEIAAFASRNPGRIYLGVNDKRKIIGIDVAQKDQMLNRIANIAQKSVAPSVQVSCDFFIHEGKTILRITVPRGSEPIYFAGEKPYVRNITIPDSATPYEVKEAHRKYFLENERLLERGAATTSQTQSAQNAQLLDILEQISDYEVLWSDHDERAANPDLRQLLYDISTTGDQLLKTSFELDEAAIANPIRAAATELKKLSGSKFYIDGGRSWNTFKETGDNSLTQLQQLKQQVIKRVTTTPKSRLSEQTQKNLRELDYLLSDIDGRILMPNRVAEIKSDLSRLAFTFGRLSIRAKLESKYSESTQLFELAVKIRAASQIGFMGFGVDSFANAKQLRRELPTLRANLAEAA